MLVCSRNVGETTGKGGLDGIRKKQKRMFRNLLDPKINVREMKLRPNKELYTSPYRRCGWINENAVLKTLNENWQRHADEEKNLRVLHAKKNISYIVPRSENWSDQEGLKEETMLNRDKFREQFIKFKSLHETEGEPANKERSYTEVRRNKSVNEWKDSGRKNENR